ncbi:hypothetical protein QBC40DRAFT_285629, partial [Triangularia verruculosa]
KAFGFGWVGLGVPVRGCLVGFGVFSLFFYTSSTTSFSFFFFTSLAWRWVSDLLSIRIIGGGGIFHLFFFLFSVYQIPPFLLTVTTIFLCAIYYYFDHVML